MRNWLSERYKSVKPRAHSTLFYLLAANLFVVIPAAALSTYLVFKYAASEEARIEQTTVQQASDIASRIDQELSSLTMAANFVSTIPSLTRGDYASFYRRATELLKNRSGSVVLLSSDGRQLVNTNRPFGDQLEHQTEAGVALTHAALASSAPIYTGFLIGKSSHRPIISVLVPAPCPEPGGCVVRISITTDSLHRLLSLDHVPHNFTVAIVDADHRIIARSVDHAKWTGAKTSDEYNTRTLEPRGFLRMMRSVDGQQVSLAYTKVARAGWTVGISVPETELTEALTESLRSLALQIALCLAIAVTASILMARNISSSIRQLAAAAINSKISVKTYVTEVNGVGEILSARQSKIEEQKTALEETIAQIHLLMRETIHRAKNQLTVIQSMAKQTARYTRNSDEFISRFSDRLQSLSRTQNMLVETNWIGLQMADLIKTQVPEAYRHRVHRAGPVVMVLPEPGQNLGMALHELADNAIKYGALSHPVGEINVTWDIDVESCRFWLQWQENNGPCVADPSETGFGSVVLRTLVAASFSGMVEMIFNEDGLIWRLQGSFEYLKIPN